MDSTVVYSPPAVRVTVMVISFTATRRPREMVTTLLPSWGPMARTPWGRERSKGKVSTPPSARDTDTAPASGAPGPWGERIRISSISTGSARDTVSSTGPPSALRVTAPPPRVRSSSAPETRLVPPPRRTASTGGASSTVSRTAGPPRALRFRVT